MQITRTPGRFLFAIPWLVVAVQHFMYAVFVAGIVPAYMPFRIFWVYFTAIAMIAAAIAIMTGIRARLAAALLGGMMVLFILLIHLPILSGDPHAMNWTRAFQDFAITGVAFIFVGKGNGSASGAGTTVGNTDRGRWLPGKGGRANWLGVMGLYCYTVPLLFLGAQHFWQVPYVTGRIPDWMPMKVVWDFLAGAVIVLSALAIMLQRRARQAAGVLGITLAGLALLYHLPELVAHPFAGMDWTAAMLDSMIASGALLLAAAPGGVPGESGVRR